MGGKLMSRVWFSVGTDTINTEWLECEFRELLLNDLNYSESFDGGDDLIPHHIVLHWVNIEGENKERILLDWDINDIRKICLCCGNSLDCCVCDDDD